MKGGDTVEPGARIIIIGAGLGGLAAAIRLAAAGHAVTVIEAASAPGGKMRTLPSAAGPVDAGPTVLTLRTVFEDLFASAGADLADHVTLTPQHVLARHWWPDGSTLDLHADPEASADAIGAFAGARAVRDFRRFNRLTAALYAAFEVPMMAAPRARVAALARAALNRPRLLPALLPEMTLARLLRSQFGDARLRQLFGRYATYVGGCPDLSPAVLALIWQAEARGVWAVAGGMHRLAVAMADLATARGAQIRYGCAAQRIIRQGGRVSGVALGGGAVLPATHVIFNGDPAALATGLLGPAPVAAIRPQAAQPRSLSAEVWGFAARASGLDLAHHNVFFTADPRDEFAPLARGQRPAAATLYLCAEDRATGQTPAAPLERFEIIRNAPATSGAAPQEFSQCHHSTFPPLARFGLTFSPEPGPGALTTPAEFHRLFPGSQGALYGRSPHGLMAGFHRPLARTGLPGLYLAGGGAHPGAGVPMATLSGQHAAEAILADLALTLPSRQMAMAGGMSMGSPMTGGAPSRSSGSSDRCFPPGTNGPGGATRPTTSA